MRLDGEHRREAAAVFRVSDGTEGPIRVVQDGSVLVTALAFGMSYATDNWAAHLPIITLKQVSNAITALPSSTVLLNLSPAQRLLPQTLF